MSDNNDNLKRRDFLGRGSALTFSLLVGGSALARAEEIQVPEDQDSTGTPARKGQPAPAKKPASTSKPVPAATKPAEPAVPPVGCAVIGLGEQGRAHLASLRYVPGANVLYVCDVYEGIHKRAQEAAPKASAVTDYRKVLDDKAVQAVWVATPSHQHKDIVLAALQAGKHVYCEAPLASSIDDARAIARAAQGAPKLVFASGLQSRVDPLHRHVLKFVRTGVLGNTIQSKAQWHKKNSWKRAAATPEREAALNWKIREETSGGLMNEVGIHHLDVASWFLKAMPLSVTGHGAILKWKDGRSLPDTVQCLVEYPGGIYLAYDATLANSYDGAYALFQGSDSAILIKDQRAWMFKESDAPSLGWEVYAAKEKWGDDTGIVLVADSSKLLELGKEPGQNREVDPTKSPLYYAGDAFLTAIREGKPAENSAEIGYTAVVTALKAHQAILSGTRVTFQKGDFDLAQAG